MNKIFIFVTLAVFLLLQNFTEFTVYESLSCCLLIYFFLSFVHNLGRRLVILDILILITIFICLVMPIAGYHHFNDRNFLSSLWGNYMRVPSDEFFAFMFPATALMILGLKIPI
ncbi:MAG TPA: hypothetical protein VGD17_11855, partial [Chitinophagaceae bacterium]